MEDNNLKPKKKFQLGCIGTIVIVIIVFFVGLFIGVAIGNNNTTNTPPTTTSSAVATNNSNTQSSNASTSASPVTLTSGNYTAGKDFPAGTYTIEAISGYGNVSSSNMYNGGLNEIMAPKGSGSSDTVSSYQNVSLPSGTTLTVSNVTIKLIPSN